MAEEYTDVSRGEAEKIAATLKQLDALLASDKLAALNANDVAGLRRGVRKMLVSMNMDLAALESVEREDIFKTNPVFATQRFQLIKNIETTKVDFEFEIVPTLEKLTRQAVKEAKQNPPVSVDVEALPPPPAGERWTVQKVIDTAEHFFEQAKKAAEVTTKGYTLVKSLALLVGFTLP